ncbi:hypothetical protein KY362_01970 [Candidatus Woesearchaeota archaeon]|nr:hypothetical protein [Candidatus Woesearchaeota archaeon]
MKGLYQVLVDENLQRHIDRCKVQESYRSCDGMMQYSSKERDRPYRPKYRIDLYKRPEKYYRPKYNHKKDQDAMKLSNRRRGFWQP